MIKIENEISGKNELDKINIDVELTNIQNPKKRKTNIFHQKSQSIYLYDDKNNIIRITFKSNPLSTKEHKTKRIRQRHT